MAKMGRPLTGNEPRKATINIRATEAEKNRVKEASKAFGVRYIDLLYKGIEALENEKNRG